jgi:hypothetical protein
VKALEAEMRGQATEKDVDFLVIRKVIAVRVPGR